MRRSDSGKATLKTVFSLAFIAAVAYFSFQIIPIYVSNYELQDYIRQLAVQATVNRASSEAIRKEVVAHAQDLGLPVDPENVKVSAGNKVTIDLDYSVPIDLKIKTLNLHFTPSAENRAL